jgi:hypothetical protein
MKMYYLDWSGGITETQTFYQEDGALQKVNYESPNRHDRRKQAALLRKKGRSSNESHQLR